MKNIAVGACIVLFISIISCSKDSSSSPVNSIDPLADLNLPAEYFNYENIQLPDHYTTNAFSTQFQRAAVEFDNTPANNRITNAGATLGRVLFYDKKLSANGTIACASCHKPEHGFSEPEILSKGFKGGRTRRHSMGLVNTRFYFGGKFFWDERAASLEDQVLEPIQDAVEMGLTLEQLQKTVKAQTYYPSLFEAAFGNNAITSDRISKALAQFIRSLVSTTSKYDKARSQVSSPIIDFPAFSELENEGKRLFFLPIQTNSGTRINCASCHVSEAFVGAPRGMTNATNNGLDAVSTDDLGIYEATNNKNDIGKFKTPSLRNIAIRPPYMHDGRFTSLQEVLDHYSTGIQKHSNLAAQFSDSSGNPIRLNLSQAQKDALIAFLKTLTDNEMLSDEKYSDPFK